MIQKIIEIDGKKVRFCASASIPRIYRHRFKRDIFKDMQELAKDVEGGNDDVSEIPIENLEIFENVAYCMAKHADPQQPDDIDDWLDQFDTFSIYTVLPQLVELWGKNLATESEAKKNFQKLQER